MKNIYLFTLLIITINTYTADNQAIQINKQNIDGRTALHIAAQNGSMNVVKTLLAYNADKKLKDNENCTPAELAEARGHLSIADYINAWNPESKSLSHN